MPPRRSSTPDGVSDDVLAFVSLARLASGDASMGDVLSLASESHARCSSPARRSAWFVIDDGSGCSRDAPRVRSRRAADAAARSLRLGEGVSGWVAANRQVIVNSEASLDLGEQARLRDAAQHALSVPLITRESLVGTMTLYSTTIRFPKARAASCR